MNTLVKNSAALIDIIGYWPNFHDSNISALTVRYFNNSVDLEFFITYAGSDRPPGVTPLEQNVDLSFNCINISRTLGFSVAPEQFAWISEIHFQELFVDGLQKTRVSVIPLSGLAIDVVCDEVRLSLHPN